MLKISDAVDTILSEDVIAQEAISRGIINYTAYAKKIKRKVEEYTKKKVQVNSIVMALSRLADQIGDKVKLIPNFHIEDLSVKSPIYALTLEKTDDNIRKVSKFREGIDEAYDFLTITQGVNELTIFYSDDLGKAIDAELRFDEKAFYDGLSGVTVNFPEEYVNMPNVIYGILTNLAVKRINLIEVVSTFSELTAVIRREDVDEALGALKELLR